MRRYWELAVGVFGGALAGIGVAYGLFGENILAFGFMGLIGAAFFPWLIARTALR